MVGEGQAWPCFREGEAAMVANRTVYIHSGAMPSNLSFL